MVIKTKFSTITAVVATIAALATIGSIGGGIGLGQQQQTALAQPVDLRDSLQVEIDLGDTVRAILEQEDEEVPTDILCPPPLKFVPIPGPERYICVDTTFDMVPTPG